MNPFDRDGIFRLAADDDRLRSLAVRGAGFTVFGQSLGFVVQMAATVILARLLTPDDFGLITMVTTFSLLVMNFGLNGFTEAVLQRDTMDHWLASNLFWINAGMGALLTIGFAASGPLLARFYGDPRVVGVAVAMSVTIILTSLSVQHLALLKRSMRFAAVSTNDIVARTGSVAVSILLGWAAWGYWALVAGAVTAPLLTLLGAWTMCRWIPGAPRRGVGTVPMVRFAINTYGRFTANYLTLNLDKLLIGSYFGPVALGFYKKAYDLFILPVNQLSAPLTSVAVSALSRVRGDSAQYQRYLLRAFATLAFIGMALGAVLTLNGRDLILLLLGSQWEESKRIFAVLGPGIGIMLLYWTHGWIHLSLGRADRWLRWGVVEFAITGGLFLLALPWGPIGIAAAWVASYSLLTIPALWYAGKPADLGIAPVIGAVWRYVLASALAGAFSAVIIHDLSPFAAAPGPLGAVGRIVVVTLLFSALYLGAVILLHRGFGPLAQVAGLLREMGPPTRFSASLQPVPTASDAGTSAVL